MRRSACECYCIFCQNFSEACTLMNTQRPKKWNRNLNVLSSIKVRQLLHWVKISIADQINAMGGENKTRTNGGQTLISSFLLVKLSNSHKWGGHIARKVRKKQKPSKAAKRTYTKWGRVGRADLSNNSREPMVDYEASRLGKCKQSSMCKVEQICAAADESWTVMAACVARTW